MLQRVIDEQMANHSDELEIVRRTLISITTVMHGYYLQEMEQESEAKSEEERDHPEMTESVGYTAYLMTTANIRYHTCRISSTLLQRATLRRSLRIQDGS